MYTRIIVIAAALITIVCSNTTPLFGRSGVGDYSEQGITPTAPVSDSASTGHTDESPIETAGAAADQVVNLPLIIGSPASEKYPADDRAFELEVLRLINVERANVGLPALIEDSALTQAARRHSVDMATNSLVGHTGSDGSRPAQRMTEEGYSGEPWGEAAGGAGSAQDMVSWWFSSAPHRGILLDPLIRRVGTGFALRAGIPRYVVDTGH
jgi:uncharacterized protein YkwD